MNEYFHKARILVPTHLLITLGGTFFIGSLFWLMSIKFHWLEETSIFWILIVPFGFPLIPLWIVLRPKLEILKFKPGHRGKFVFHLITGLTLYGSIYSIQQIVSTDTGKMTSLSKIYDIENYPITRFYSIDDYYIDTSYVAYYYDVDYDYDGSSSLDLSLYVAFPMYFNPEDLDQPNAIKYWFGITFERSVDSHFSEEEEEKEIKATLAKCFKSLSTFPFEETTFFMARSMQGKDNYFYKAINASFGTPSSDKILVFYPRYVPFESRSDGLTGWFIFIQGIGLTLFMLLLLWPDYSE